MIMETKHSEQTYKSAVVYGSMNKREENLSLAQNLNKEPLKGFEGPCGGKAYFAFDEKLWY